MKIFIIEHNGCLNPEVRSRLKEHGYTYDEETRDIERGVRYATLNQLDYDLILLALSVSDTASGCRRLREHDVQTPLLAVFASEINVDEKIKILDAGADECITPPYSPEELMANIRALLRRPDEMVPPEIHHANLTLNPSTRTVAVGKHHLRLDLKQFEILHQLMRHPGRVVTRTHLLDRIWDINFSPKSNVLDVHVHHLRKRLREHGSATTIETIHQIGFRLK